MISAIASLDREAVEVYTLQIVATDDGFVPLSTTSSLTVTVSDTNDNPPIFAPTTAACTLFETDPIGTTCLTVTSTDADAGVNASVNYSVVTGSNPLCDATNTVCIDQTTGRVTTNSTLIFAATTGQVSASTTFTFQISAHDPSPRHYLGGAFPGAANGFVEPHPLHPHTHSLSSL